MKLGIIAGNRLLPVILAQKIKEKHPDGEVIAVCFRGETSSCILRYINKAYWLGVGSLGGLKKVITDEKLKEWFLVGQINPLRIFKRNNWDEELTALIENSRDLRPHNIFSEIISFLEKQAGVTFLDSTLYLKDELAQGGLMAGSNLDTAAQEDIDFGLKIISRFVELDVGQTVVVKKKSVVALESLEGTDRTIRRGYRLAGFGCTVLKFSKSNQDLRFDVPVVGVGTLELLRRIKAGSLVLEKGKVIILEKEKFLSLARKWGIAIVGAEKSL